MQQQNQDRKQPHAPAAFYVSGRWWEKGSAVAALSAWIAMLAVGVCLAVGSVENVVAAVAFLVVVGALSVVFAVMAGRG